MVNELEKKKLPVHHLPFSMTKLFLRPRVFSPVYSSSTAPTKIGKEDSDDGVYSAVIASLVRKTERNNKVDNVPLNFDVVRLVFIG